MSMRMTGALGLLVTCGLLWSCGDDGNPDTGVASSSGTTTTNSGSTTTATAGGGVGGEGAGGSGASGGQGGQGAGPIACDTADTCPGADTSCSQRTCDNQVCGADWAAKGTPCTDGSGTLCDGAGTCAPWAPLSTVDAPSPRYEHSAIWTGSHMIVWGGAPAPGQVTDTGHKYDPQTDSWTPISTVGAPEPRRGHAAIWTGTYMLIWGGYGQGNFASDGARYNPATDSWSPMATANQPTPRTKFSAVWDYNHQYWIIWGGLLNATPLGNGSRYDALSNSWVVLPSTNAPSARLAYSAAWVPPVPPHSPNGHMVLYGGTNTFDWHNNGALLDPVTLTWTPINMLPGASEGGTPPSNPLESSAAILVGGTLLIWGGWDGGNYYGDGYYLFPGDKPGGFWSNVQQNGAPSARSAMITLPPGFTGMFIWGGCGGMACSNSFDDGGIWTFGANGGTWENIPSDPALVARRDTAAVSTGTEAIIWGGRIGTSNVLGDGARRLINP